MSSMPIRVAENGGEKFIGGSLGVLVGAEKKLFSVHEKLIRASSQFFDRAMSGAWLESAQRTIQLPEDEAEIFGIYVHWLYYGTLPVCSNDSGLPENHEYLKLVKAYTLGNKLMDMGFQNAAIDAIVEKSISEEDGTRWYPVTEVVEFAYNNTRNSDPIRQLLVDLHVSFGHGDWLDYGNFDPESVPRAFLFGLSSKLLDLRAATRSEIKASNYHVHDSSDVKVESEKEAS
ncbi:BTB/POZ [Penicillium occitanis (nom. inval.)]|nr:BTB/POZ [Penicillium occitanis (nom. inval.)]PCH01276.1 hypothetical protein PENOC_049100 [Penicillium occitanis (nom. inval.)]